jgi:hypothetical protein
MPRAACAGDLLHLADEATDLWQKTEDELGAIGLPPPFWASPGRAARRSRVTARQSQARAGPARARLRCRLRACGGRGRESRGGGRRGQRHRALRDDRHGLNAAANGVAIRPREADLVDTDEGWGRRARRRHPLREGHGGARHGVAREPARARHPRARGRPRPQLPAKERLEPLATYEVPGHALARGRRVKRTSVWRFRA